MPRLGLYTLKKNLDWFLGSKAGTEEKSNAFMT